MAFIYEEPNAINRCSLIQGLKIINRNLLDELRFHTRGAINYSSTLLSSSKVCVYLFMMSIS